MRMGKRLRCHNTYGIIRFLDFTSDFKELCADGEYVDRKINSTPIDSQEQFFEEAYKNADKSADN